MPTSTLGSLRLPPGVVGDVYFAVRVEGGPYLDFATGQLIPAPARPLGKATRAADWDPCWDFTAEVPADVPTPCWLLVAAYLIQPGEERGLADPASIPAGRHLKQLDVIWPLWYTGGDVAAQTPAPPPTPTPTSPQCQGVTAAGTRCTRKATANGYCYQHAPKSSA